MRYKCHYCQGELCHGSQTVQLSRTFYYFSPLASCIAPLDATKTSSKSSKSILAQCLSVLSSKGMASFAIESDLQILGDKQGQQQYPVLFGESLGLLCQKQLQVRIPSLGTKMFVRQSTALRRALSPQVTQLHLNYSCMYMHTLIYYICNLSKCKTMCFHMAFQ